MIRSFPQNYRAAPGGGGPVSVTPGEGGIPAGAAPAAAHYKVTPGARVSPLGSALYLPPTRAMVDRTLPADFWGAPARP